jgi:membrane protein required for beta-lactamase induction
MSVVMMLVMVMAVAVVAVAMTTVMTMTTVMAVAVVLVGLGRRDPTGHHQPRRDAEREDQSFHRTASKMRVSRGSVDTSERDRQRGLRRPGSSRQLM